MILPSLTLAKVAPWVALAYVVSIAAAGAIGYARGASGERDRRDAQVLEAQVSTYARARLAAERSERERREREGQDAVTRTEVIRYVTTQAAGTECFTADELVRFNSIGNRLRVPGERPPALR